jgi:hypothetical protein
LLLLVLGAFAGSSPPGVGQHGWLAQITEFARHYSSRIASRSRDDLAAVVETIQSRADGSALAAEATAEGHWRFVNRSGETFTAGSAEEIGRGIDILVPGEPEIRRGIELSLTAESVLARAALVKDLPQNLKLSVVVNGTTYPIVRPQGERLFADRGDGLLLEIIDRRLFDETLELLARPISRPMLRVIGLEPGGPATLSRSPRFDEDGQPAAYDVIDPDRLRHTLSAVSGQTIVVTGRIEGDIIYFKPSSGPERSLFVGDLTAAAAVAAVDLILLDTQAALQPGNRNWLWQRITVKGLDAALARATIADLLIALSAPDQRMLVSVSDSGLHRLLAQAKLVSMGEGRSLARPVLDAVVQAFSGLAGRSVVSGVYLSVPSNERFVERHRRVLPGVPSLLQWTYLALLALGLLGLPSAKGWWGRLWPPEQRTDYASRLGYLLARLVRTTLFVLVFAPLVSLLSVPVTLGHVWLGRRSGGAPDTAQP